MDTNKWPESARYFRSLSGGLKAFPAFTAKADASIAVVEALPALRTADGVDAEVRAAIAGMTVPDAWVPDVLAVLVRLMAKDLQRMDDEAFLAWNFELSARVFKRPLYRALMYVMSPSLVLSNAAKRWSTFRLGSTLERSGVTKHAGKVILRAPDGLYPLLIRRGFAESFRAALIAAGAQTVRCVMSEAHGTETIYQIDWS